MSLWQPLRRRRATLMLAAATLFVLTSVSGSQQLTQPAVAGSAAGCPGAQGALDANPTFVKLTFTNVCGQPVQLAVDVAADAQSQERGLMNVQHLPADQGELFDMANINSGAEVQESFWMEDTLIPLSIAFVGKDSTLHELQDMAENTTELHTPSQPYLYAVETNQGWFTQHDIQAGSKVDLTSALATIGPNPAH